MDIKKRTAMGFLSFMLIPLFVWLIWKEVGNDDKSELEEKLSDKTSQSDLSKKVAAALSPQEKSNTTNSQAESAAENQTVSPNTAPSQKYPSENSNSSEEENTNESENASQEEKNNYKNDNLKISFDYPKDYSVSEESEKLIKVSKGETYWRMRFYDDKNNEDIETWFKDYFDAKDNTSCAFSDQEIRLGSYEGKAVKINESEKKCDDAGNYVINSDKTKIVRIYEDNDTKENINKTLESFKFL